jgi:pilus assembly protein CpaD
MLAKDFLRAGSLVAVLLAGSCASPEDPGWRVADPEVNHPITVAPQYQSVKFPFSVANAGLMPDDAARFEAFVEDYQQHGNGAITVSVPAGPYANATISYFGERLADMGIPRARVLVGTHDVAGGDTRVELGFVGYAARVANCGDAWSEDLASTGDNQPMPNFGCAVQNNIAAMVADPRDLVQPRGMDPSDGARRKTVVGHYEKGEKTAADKNKADMGNEQSGTSSQVHQ